MAKARKKAKARSKVKRRKIAKKPLKKQIAKKPLKKQIAKKPLKRQVAKKPLKKAVPKKVSRKPKAPKPATPPPPPPPGERIGVVTHYYGDLSVAVVKLEPGATLRVGDNIHVKGHTSDFGQRVDSLQVGHAPVQEVGPNDDFGLKVAQHAREHDVVYRIKPS